MKRLDEIFDIWYGVNLEVVNCIETDKNQGVPFVSRTTENNGVATYVVLMPDTPLNPAKTISVACSGSVLSTFYHPYEYYSGRDVYILKPKANIPDEMMLLYCVIIERNKYKYSYGRQANKTLGSLVIPDAQEFVGWTETCQLCNFVFKKKPILKQSYNINIEDWKWFEVDNLFARIDKCKCSNATEFLEDGNDIAYIGAKKSNNGVMRYVNYDKGLVTKGNCIVFIGDGQGSVGYCTYQPTDFIGSTTLLAGYNKYLNVYVAQFLITVLDLERYRYSFGRKYKKDVIKTSRIKLPATQNGEPDWKFMENYIKSLPYSSNI